MKKIVNGVEVEMTQADVDEYNALKQHWESSATQRLIDSIIIAIELKIDSTAKERRYSNALSIATYTNSTNTTWKAEAKAFVLWRDNLWAYAIQQLELFQSDERDVTSAQDFINELPIIEWPNLEHTL